MAKLLAGWATLQCQDPITLPSGSEPEPDFAIVRPRSDNYLSGHPTPADILLVIKIADSSLDYDRDVKRSLYAEAGITHYWIFNLLEHCLEAYSEPYQNGEVFNYHLAKRNDRPTCCGSSAGYYGRSSFSAPACQDFPWCLTDRAMCDRYE